MWPSTAASPSATVNHAGPLDQGPRIATGTAWFTVALGLAAVLGHMFSPYVRFRGGKGVATAAGMFLALAPLAIGISLLIWILALWLRVTVPDQPYTFWASVVLALLIIYAHRANIQRLSAGTEHRFRTRKGV